MVERDLAKVDVAGPTPVSRSNPRIFQESALYFLQNQTFFALYFLMRPNGFTSPAAAPPEPARGVPGLSPFAAGGVVTPP